MHYVLVDDSIPFDGFSPTRKALGGAEKAFASMTGALARQGHTVTAINRTPYAISCEGANWRPFDDLKRPLEADVLIAFRQVPLLGAVRRVKHRMLWVTSAPDYLMDPSNEKLWDSFEPRLLFISSAQRQEYRGRLPSHVLVPGVREQFWMPSAPRYDPYDDLGDDYAPPPPPPPPPVPPPHCVVTTHPQHGLDFILDVWRRLIHPQLPEAKLTIYSNSLSKAGFSASTPPALRPLLAQVQEGAQHNISAAVPRPDQGMAEAYRGARVHLYPGHPQDYACWTLQESQTAGLPAVARAVGGVQERIVNGSTGYVVPDAEAFANVTLEILKNDAVYKNLHDAAGSLARRRSWDLVVHDLEEIVHGKG
jgi:glycosyltransferase involved in cell wall biosynthesis